MPTENVERKLVAILHADIKGYSRLMGEDEVGTLRMLTAYREVTDTLIHQHRGRIVSTAGDSILAEFASAVDAVQCAAETQQALKTRNADLPSEQRMEFRIGIHVGDVIVEGPQIYGDGVNIAARLEALAEGGGIYVSGTVYDQVENKLKFGYEYLGEQTVKNIAKPVRVYRVQGEAKATATAQGRGEMISPLQAPALPLPDKPSIIILPFTNMSNDPEQEYFSDGITEDITTDLSKISSLFVIARNSAFTYKGKAVKVQDASHEMGVRYVLEGSVRKAGDQVRVTAQLIDATTGYHLWSERYNRALKDIFTLQDDVVQNIVTTLKLQLTLQEQGILMKKTTDSLEAYDTYLRGLGAWVRAYYAAKQDANAQARQLFERATELDSHYAHAYLGLGLTYWLEWFYLWNPTPQTLARVSELAQQAITLEDSLPEPHALLGAVSVWQKRHEVAIKEAQRATALDPNFAEGYHILGLILAYAGQPEEGIRVMEQAMRLNPRYPDVYLFDMAIAYRVAGRYEEALVLGKKFQARQPDYVFNHFHLAVCYAELDRLEEARTEAAEFVQFTHFSLQQFRNFWPMKDPAVMERTLVALRKAGLKWVNPEAGSRQE